MRGNSRWRSNWQVIGPAGATRLQLPRSHAARRSFEQLLRDLPAGAAVVIAASAPRARARCRTAAARGGVVLERTYLAFPSCDAPAYLVEDAPATARAFVTTVLAVPPHTTSSLPLLAALRILRSIGTRRCMRLVAPGHVVVGRRM